MTGSETPTPSLLSRRTFLELAAIGGSAALVSTSVPGRAASRALRLAPGDALVASITNGTLTLSRSDDQVHLQFVFLNLELSGQELVAIDQGEPSAIKIVFGSQYSSQASIDTAVDAIPGAAATVAHRGAEATRVVTTVAPPLPFTVASLLALADRSMALDPRATGGTGSGPIPDDLTAIALPTDITLSPTGLDARFSAPAAPVTHDAVTELWRAELGRVGVIAPNPDLFFPASPGMPVELRAPEGGAEADAFPRALRQTLRQDLVEATTDFGSTRYPANEPLLASRLALSIQGAWASIAGSWAGRGALAAYAEAVVSGRAVDISVTERGFLAPFGHVASVVEMRERRFETAADGSIVAVLVESEAFLVEASTVRFPNEFMPYDGRDFLFETVTLAAPTGDIGRGTIEWTDQNGDDRSIDPDVIFELVDGDGIPIDFGFVATDAAGNEVSFVAPCQFVPDEIAHDQGNDDVQTLVDLWGDQSIYGINRSFVTVPGVPLPLAEEAEPGSGATTKPVTAFEVALRGPAGATTDELESSGVPAFVPYLRSIDFQDPTLADATGAGTTPTFRGSFHPRYLEFGTAPGARGERPDGHGNPRNEYIELSVPVTIDVESSAGGVVAPSFEVNVVGQDNGVSIDLDATGGVWDPLDALGDAKLLGIIPLAEVLNALIPSGDPVDEPGIPAFEIAFDGPPGLPPETLCIELAWEPQVKTWSFAGEPVLIVRDDLATYGLDDPFDGPTAARFAFERCIALDGSGTPVDDLEVVLENVGLQVPPGLPALALQLREVGIVQKPSTGIDYLFDIAGFQFVGILELLEPFRTILGDTPSGGLDLSFADDVVDIDIGFTAPDVNLGQVRLTNITAGITAGIPLAKGTPFSAGFYVGRVTNPLKVGVWIFDGLGSFEIVLAPPPDGLLFLEASLGIGATIAAQGLGVKGSVSMSVAASITYDKSEPVATQIAIGGHFSLDGEVKAWGVLGVGVEGTLSLTYFLNSKVLQAKGKVTGSVTIVATKEWSVEVEEQFQVGSAGPAFGPTRRRRRQLAGADEPYSFVDAYPSDAPWTTYCDAFA